MSGHAFDNLFREHFSFVWRCLRGLGVPEADLDDVSQEVFVVVHRRLADLQPGLGVRPWLYGILRLVARNHGRGARRRTGRHTALRAEPPPTSSDPLESLQAREAASLVSRLLEGLEVNRREVFMLVELEELPVPEVATALAIPVNTAYSRLRLARADFKAAMRRQGSA